MSKMTALRIWCLCVFLLVPVKQINCASLPSDDASIEKKVDEQTYVIEPSIDSRQMDTDFLPTEISPFEEFDVPKDAQVIVEVNKHFICFAELFLLFAYNEIGNLFYPLQQFAGTPKPLAEFNNPPDEKPTASHSAQRPTAPYPPQRPITQYLNTNAGPYLPEAPNGMAPAWSQFLSHYGSVPYPFPFWVPAQTEYEGFLVPVQMKNQAPTLPSPPTVAQPYTVDSSNTMTSKSPSGDIVAILRSILPPSVLYFLVNWGSIIVNSFSIIVFGGIMTTAICTLTPLCTISLGTLPFAFRSEFAGKEANQTASNTLERVRRATEMLSSAIETYEELQKSVANDKKSKRSGK